MKLLQINIEYLEYLKNDGKDFLKGSIGHAFTVCIHTENQNQVSFYPFVLHEISLLIELTLGHLRYHLADVPPQPNLQPDSVFDMDRPANGALILENEL